MTITKDVIRDLMPIYLAGEGSKDTRRLVEEYLREHPDEAPLADLLTLPEVEPADCIEMASLDRTRKIYDRRSMALGAALAVSYGVFSFRFGSKGPNFVLFRDLPTLSWVLLAAAAVIWVAFFVLHRQWVETGIAGSNSHFNKVQWMAIGMVAALPYAFVASYQLALDDVRALCVVGAFAGAAIGAALHRKK